MSNEANESGGILKKAKTLAQRAYHLAFLNSEGKFSPFKAGFTAIAIAYLVFINPLLVAGLIELFIIFTIIMFLIRLFFYTDTSNTVIKTEAAQA